MSTFEQTAFHEAGHIVVAIQLGYRVRNLTIETCIHQQSGNSSGNVDIANIVDGTEDSARIAVAGPLVETKYLLRRCEAEVSDNVDFEYEPLESNQLEVLGTAITGYLGTTQMPFGSGRLYPRVQDSCRFMAGSCSIPSGNWGADVDRSRQFHRQISGVLNWSNSLIEENWGEVLCITAQLASLQKIVNLTNGRSFHVHYDWSKRPVQR